jgi:hypothetical protein
LAQLASNTSIVGNVADASGASIGGAKPLAAAAATRNRLMMNFIFQSATSSTWSSSS